jgi:hypothetical protein
LFDPDQQQGFFFGHVGGEVAVDVRGGVHVLFFLSGLGWD